MLTKEIRKALEATARAGGIPTERVAAGLATMEGEVVGAAAEARPALLSQAQKARQLGVSRFTVRKLVVAGKLHPVELLPGLLRYRADELI